ncbi:MAG: C4-dicarboxylate transporter DcuC [Verrucomicrobia bacterium]|nr:C4-dicarboxylate transporter DcuC [Verrucomicrobiota bacterium]
MELPIALLVIAAAIYFVFRGTDVRLVLFTAGLTLASIAGHPLSVFKAFERSIGDATTIGPICSAMGYAFVLRATGCDREMVRLLLAPVRRVKWLLVPGACVVGFVTNIAITSQTGAAASVGAIIIPLMLAAGYHPIIAGATLVLGCSGGGSLYNVGDADLVALQAGVKAPMSDVLGAMFLPLLGGFTVAVVTFTWLSRRPPTDVVTTASFAPVDESEPIHFFKALLPPLPVMMIFSMLPTLNFFPALRKIYDRGLPVSHAMLLSTIIVLLVYRKELSARTKAFFDGMGFAYINVISLIVTASCFIEGMKAMGLIERMVGAISANGALGWFASGVSTCLLGVLSGSGIAPSVAFSQAVLPTYSVADPGGAIALGVWAAIAANFGRTMSPVAAVVIFTATLVNVTPMQLAKRTAVPMIVGALAAFLVVFVHR